MSSTNRTSIFSTLFLLILVATPVEKVEATGIFNGEFYASDLSGNLFKVNTTTGSPTFIGNMGTVMTDIAFSPSGNLFGITFTDLFSIDPNTAASTRIGNLGVNGANALEFDASGRLFVAISTLLGIVNTTTGATTVIGNMGVSSGGDLAFDVSSGNLFLTTPAFPNDDLYKINPISAASTLVGNIGFSGVFGLDFSGSTLFGLTNRGQLIAINTTNGAGILVANTGVAAFGGASTAPVFEAEPAATRTDCKTAGCKIPVTCNLSQNCTNLINLLVRARDVRPREATRAKALRMIRIASTVANIPPGATKTVRLNLTKPGRNIVRNSKKRRFKGVIEIRNAPGAFDTTPITIRLR